MYSPASSQHWELVIATTAAVAAMAAAFALCRTVLPLRQRRTREASHGPWWFHFLVRSTDPLARKLAGRFPSSLVQWASKRLLRAGIEDICGPTQWLTVSIGMFSGVGAAAFVASGSTAWSLFLGICVALILERWLLEKSAARSASARRELPAVIDTFVVAVEAGCSVGVALRLCANQCPAGVIRGELARVAQGMRAGESQTEALSRMVDRLELPAVATFAASIQHAAQTGASLAPLLRMQVTQRSEERFSRAEKLAMEAPVKMLLPLIVCLFPCAFIVLAFPIASRLLEWQ